MNKFIMKSISRTLITIIMLNIFSIFVCNGQSTRPTQGPCDSLKTPGKEYLLDRESRKCYSVGTRGPCGELMIFYKNPVRKSIYGFCDCDTGFQSESPCKDSPIRKRIYIHRFQRCFTVFSQGPCKTNEWLELNEDGFGVCKLNSCSQHDTSKATSDQFWFYDQDRKQCYQTFTQGYCSEGMTLELTHESEYPICKIKDCYASLVYGVSSILSCKSGTRFSYLTNSCRKTFKNAFTLG